jgi:hypothetical protein
MAVCYYWCLVASSWGEHRDKKRTNALWNDSYSYDYLAFFAFLTVFTFFGLCYSSDCHDKSGDRKALEATTQQRRKDPRKIVPHSIPRRREHSSCVGSSRLCLFHSLLEIIKPHSLSLENKEVPLVFLLIFLLRVESEFAYLSRYHKATDSSTVLHFDKLALRKLQPPYFSSLHNRDRHKSIPQCCVPVICPLTEHALLLAR